MNPRDRSYLEDMLSYSRDAIELLGDSSEVELGSDKQKRFAVLRAIEVVGEAASKVSDSCRVDLASVPWRTIIGMRNLLIHGYRSIDLAIVADTVKADLPSVIGELEKHLGDDPA